MVLRGLLISLGVFALSGAALAQTDYTAGKTPAQLFAGDCSACHKTPRGLAKGRDARALTGFLREHYTTKSQSAGALANYLLSNPTAPPTSASTEPADGRKPAQAARGKKPDPAELAREAAKQAEEETKAKVRGYATAGEIARPYVSPDQMPAAEPAPEPAKPAPTATEAAPAATEAKPAGEDRPATPPPG